MTILSGVISYPIPPYQNVPIEPQFYQPRRFVISGVILGTSTTITTLTDHDYVIGQQIRLIIPSVFGCYQLNESFGYVLEIPANNSVVVDINSSKNVDEFNFVSSNQQPAILAIGDVNTGATNISGRTNQITYIPGSFLDISPA